VGSTDAGGTAWVLASAALVLPMTPGVAFFYGGRVRRTKLLAVLMQSFATRHSRPPSARRRTHSIRLRPPPSPLPSMPPPPVTCGLPSTRIPRGQPGRLGRTGKLVDPAIRSALLLATARSQISLSVLVNTRSKLKYIGNFGLVCKRPPGLGCANAVWDRTTVVVDSSYRRPPDC
jgi:hypothetical protein